jgi:cell division protein FtsQ
MTKRTTRQKTSQQAAKAKAKCRRRQQLKRIGLASVPVAFALTVMTGTHLHIAEWWDTQTDAIHEAFHAELAEKGFKLNSLTIEGRDKTDKAQLIESIELAAGDSIFLKSPAEIRERIEGLSTVRKATVERTLPDMLHITITERSPVAVWQRNKELYVVDAEGVVLENEDPKDYPHLMVLVGDDVPQHLEEFFALLQSEPDLVPHVNAAVRVAKRRWNVHLREGVEILLPETGTQAAWKKLAEWQREQRLLDKAVGSIDFRLGDKVFIGLEPTGEQKTPAHEV